MKGGEAKYVTCPGQSYAITIEMCRARQGWGFPGCRRCPRRVRKQEQKEPSPPATRDASHPTLFDLS